MTKDILQPVNTTTSTSPSIRRAAEEPSNWRALGQPDVQQAIKDNPTKNPVSPTDNK